MKRIVILTIIVLGVTVAIGQPQSPAPDGFGDPGDPVVPIDGISSLLIAGGILFGGKKAYDLKKKNEEHLS
ncbi:PID-CTERM protein-sorting domain-containing protein [Salibacter sp.]|uniref:PID-CTERM protein-sorting domain-containing protein n=1 Tax=Salibacter sp. TaxID=2010995 RepID=UPI00286FDB2E|nr:hypothetical protein [Salibacter sp.]MDR9397696.1 hypothetical protein [Salibacter sp.]MDR9488157.1 hypothetical protein [Salibacter sp.]